MNNASKLVLAAAIAATFSFFLWPQAPPRTVEPASRPPAPPKTDAIPAAMPPPEKAADAPPEYAVPPGGSPLARSLNAPGNTAAQDVKILSDITRQFLSVAKDTWRPPIGDNPDLAAVLRGSNRHHLVYIPAGHPAYDPQGRLIDRFGTPYFVHPLSSAHIEIRSAGPDRKMFTADDEE
jgi:hypothetical protein